MAETSFGTTLLSLAGLAMRLPTAQLRILRSLLGYVARFRPDAIVAVGIGILSSGLELASLASLLPLSRLAGNQIIPDTSPWHRLPVALGFAPNVKFYATAFLALL